MRGVDHGFDGRDTEALLAVGDEFLCEGEILENGIGLRPLLEEVVVLKEVVVPHGGVRKHEALHGHGVLLHDVVDAGIRIDDDLEGERASALAVEHLVVGKAFAERPVAIHDRHADRGVGIEHLLGRDDLDLIAIDVEAHLAETDLGNGVVRFIDQVEIPLRAIEERLRGFERRLRLGDVRHGHGRATSSAGRSGEQLVEDREDLGRARHAAHGEMLVALRDLLVAVPHDRITEADLLAHLDIGEILTCGQ